MVMTRKIKGKLNRLHMGLTQSQYSHLKFKAF